MTDLFARPRLHAVLRSLALLGAFAPGCTADFFVGPEVAGTSTGEPATTTTGTAPTSSSTPDDDDDAPPPTTTGADPSESTTMGEDMTEGDSETPDSTTGDPDTGRESDSESEGDTRPQGCELDPESCEAAFPECLFEEGSCFENPCAAPGEKACLEEAPDCAWEGEACLPTECGGDSMCSELGPPECEKTEGCILVGEGCFETECVPCGLVEDEALCNELPQCEYNAKDELCVP